MKTHKNHLRLLILLLLVLLACAGYMTVGVHFENQKLFAYAMRIRTPKLIAMLITAFAIGSASIVFQSIINNTIVTPCLLGMDQLYSLIHTAVFFVAGSGSFLAVNANAAFAVDLAILQNTALAIFALFRHSEAPFCEKRIYKVSVSITHQPCDFHPQRMRKGRFHICSLWQPLK
mgnify:CR=1 FL=1